MIPPACHLCGDHSPAASLCQRCAFAHFTLVTVTFLPTPVTEPYAQEKVACG